MRCRSSLSASSRAAIRKILVYTRRHDGYLVSGHVRSDGDALGAQLAFYYLLKKLGKRSRAVCDAGALPEYLFLPGADRVGTGPDDVPRDITTVFTFDTASWGRLGRIAAELPREKLFVINVDHHASNERFGDINWIDPSYSSAGEMVWEIIKASGIAPNRTMAKCVYTAMVTDTGRFSFSNTTIETHLRAAELMGIGVRPAEIHQLLYRQKTLPELRFLSECLRRIRLSPDGRVGWISISRSLVERSGFAPGDTQEYVDTVKSIKGVRVAILLRETNEPGRVKVSWRTDTGVDGIQIASKWGGGGHPRAAGATVRGSLAAVEREIIAATSAFVKTADR